MLYLTENLFLFFKKNEIILWNCDKKKQYVIDKNHLDNIVKLAQSGGCENQIEQHLLNEGVAVKNEQSQDWGWGELSRFFHIGTKDVRNFKNIDEEILAENYIQECSSTKVSESNYFTARKGEILNLPKPQNALLNKFSFTEVLAKRKTVRNFLSKSIPLADFSSLIFHSFGVIHPINADFEALSLKRLNYRRAYPSSGGLHSEEVYIVVYRINDLAPGLYQYDPYQHALILIKLGYFESEVIEMNYSQHFANGLAFGVYFSYHFSKLWKKYSNSRSYRIALMDIGHASQNFLQCATAAGLATWLSGAFDDSDVEKFLGIDGINEAVLLFVGAGHGTNESIPQSMQKLLKQR